MNRPGAGPQPMRNITNNVFQNQQPSNSRSGAINSGRLQNGKLTSSGPNWAFGLGAAGAPGLPAQQQGRTNLSSFAQTIGGGQSQAQLDLSEFPSLSGAPQSQQGSSGSGAAIWGSSGLRGPQNAPGQQRPQQSSGQQISSQAVQPPSQTSRLQQQRSADASKDAYGSPFPQLGGSDLGDFRFGQGASGLASRSSEHHGGVDDFPPLGGLGGPDIGSLNRVTSGQDPHSNGASNGSAFDQMGSLQNRDLPSLDIQNQRGGPGSDRIFSPVDGASRQTPMSRSPFEQLDQDGMPRPDQTVGGRVSQNSGQTGYPLSQTQSNQLAYRSNQLSDAQPQRYIPQHQQSESMSGLPSEAGQPSQPNNLSNMSEIDRYGLPGLMELLRGNVSQDQAALAMGMNLRDIGLDMESLNRNSPLHTDWAGPFADSGRPLIPEFNLPATYTVNNVPPLHTRIGSFSDDTLFMIFYQNPRDEAQELAAQELYKRDWRWHKKLQSWMMKATELGDPVVNSSRTEERGVYYFWDAANWRRERKEFILSYEHLHHPMDRQGAENALGISS